MLRRARNFALADTKRNPRFIARSVDIPMAVNDGART